MGARWICSQKLNVYFKDQDGLTRLMIHGFCQDNDEDDEALTLMAVTLPCGA